MNIVIYTKSNCPNCTTEDWDAANKARAALAKATGAAA